ncbi:hypothetical protein J6P92_07445 [bacterium]|nr:hypothetical protein [bacterium]
MRISFGNNQNKNNNYYFNQQSLRDAEKSAVKVNDVIYNVADPPVNMLLRYEIKPNQIKNDNLRNTINTVTHTQAEFFSMTQNPFWIANKITHLPQTVDSAKKYGQTSMRLIDKYNPISPETHSQP